MADAPHTRPAALLLDALGTLVELEAPAPALRAELAQRFGVEVDLAQAERGLAAEMRYYRAHLQDGRDERSLASLRLRCAEVLRAGLAPAPGLDTISSGAMAEALMAALRFRAFPDAAPLLEAARRAGLRVVVVSNWDVSLPEVLERTGLGGWLDGVVTSAEVGERKPARRVFERALTVAGCAPGQALHVGDSPVEDIEGARSAGVEAILIGRAGRLTPPGVPAIRSLRELERLLTLPVA